MLTIDSPIKDTFDISVTPDKGVFSITIPDYGDGVGYFLKDAIIQQLVKLPFIYTFTVTVVQK